MFNPINRFWSKITHTFCKLDCFIKVKFPVHLNGPFYKKSVSKFTAKFICRIEPECQFYETFFFFTGGEKK